MFSRLIIQREQVAIQKEATTDNERKQILMFFDKSFSVSPKITPNFAHVILALKYKRNHIQT